MYITNNRITTDKTFSSDMDLLNYVADESILVNENALSFQEAIAEDYVLPRIYAKGTDNKTMNFIEFFESKPNDSNLDSMRNILSYRTNTPSWTSSLFEVTLTDELLNRVKKILTHFTGILSDDMEQEVALWNAKTKVENTLATVTLDDIDSVIYYEKPLLTFERLLETYLGVAPRGIRSFIAAMQVWLKEKLFLKTQLKKQFQSLQKELVPGEKPYIPKFLFLSLNYRLLLA